MGAARPRRDAILSNRGRFVRARSLAHGFETAGRRRSRFRAAIMQRKSTSPAGEGGFGGPPLSAESPLVRGSRRSGLLAFERGAYCRFLRGEVESGRDQAEKSTIR